MTAVCSLMLIPLVPCFFLFLRFLLRFASVSAVCRDMADIIAVPKSWYVLGVVWFVATSFVCVICMLVCSCISFVLFVSPDMRVSRGGAAAAMWCRRVPHTGAFVRIVSS